MNLEVLVFLFFSLTLIKLFLNLFFSKIVDKIRAGNPCEKAERLRKIKGEANGLPQTDHLSAQLNLSMSRQSNTTVAAANEKKKTENSIRCK